MQFSFALCNIGSLHHLYCTAAYTSSPIVWNHVFLEWLHGSHWCSDYADQSQAIRGGCSRQQTRILLYPQLPWSRVFLAQRHEHHPVGKKNSFVFQILHHCSHREVSYILRVLRNLWDFFVFTCILKFHVRKNKPQTTTKKNTNKIQAWIVGIPQLVTQFWLAFINIDSNQVHAKNCRCTVEGVVDGMEEQSRGLNELKDYENNAKSHMSFAFFKWFRRLKLPHLDIHRPLPSWLCGQTNVVVESE